MIDEGIHRKGGSKPHADKSGQGEGLGKQVFCKRSLWTTPKLHRTELSFINLGKVKDF